MALRVERRDGSAGRTVLIAMIVSNRVCGAVADKWDRGLFASRWEGLVAGWCVDHFKKYGHAPGRDIEQHYDDWTQTGQDKETVGLVGTFLSGLSDEYETHKRALNPEHVLDVAARLFNKVKVNALRDSLESDMEVDDVEKAWGRIETTRRVEIGIGTGINLITDDSANDAALSETHTQDIITYPDAAGEFFRGILARDSLLGFMGKEKIGKSRFLLDMAVRGVEQKRNVAYFEVGDNSQDQLLRRYNVRIAGRPFKPETYHYPVEITDLPEGKKLPGIRRQRRSETDFLTPELGTIFRRRLEKQVGSNRFMGSCHPAKTISVNGIKSILDGWLRDVWESVDCVIIDYADILAPIDPRADRRDQINDSWVAMRSLSQAYHCLVVTATQTDSDSYNSWLLSRMNFSEDKRKYGQVNGMIGINQTDEEKGEEIYRLNPLMHRDLEYSETKCLWCAASISVGDPFVLSTFGG